MSHSDEEFVAWLDAALPSLLRFGHLLTGDARPAEDLVQNALLRTWSVHRRRSDTGTDAIRARSAYVKRAMVNLQTSWWHRKGWRELVGRTAEQDLADPTGAHYEDRDLVWRALSALPAQQRCVIVLRFYEDLPEREIAEVMGVTRGTVKSHSARALKRLRVLLDDELPEMRETRQGGKL